MGDEPLTEWRDALRERYLPVIRGIDSPKEAFDRLYTHIVRNFKLVDGSDFSVIADPLTVHRTLRGTCSTRSMYIVYAARSLAIPAAYEYVDFWANYSNAGHSWAAYIDSRHAPYVVFDRDTVSVKGGIIDASYFPKTTAFDDTDTPFHIDSLKRAARIKRLGFSVNRKTCPKVDFNDPDHLRGG
ncbi:MAG: transglutaminase-like domain-containing protein [Rikenellaceae bacterium]|nr:transglutaminase-like domain-containing protein [Rikenellaceae bacterium]